MAVVVRPYLSSDRVAVRRICCDTADAGRPLEGLLGQAAPVAAVRELFADLLTAPYTDCAPDLTWVSLEQGEVVGYVMGALDRVSFDRALRWRVLPRALAAAALRGAFLDAALLRFAWANRRRPPMPPLRGFPAHLHVNLDPAARGRGAGSALVETFLDAARARGVPGVSASVREDNEAGRAFFRHLGFRPLARRPVLRTPGGVWLHAVIHGRALAA